MEKVTYWDFTAAWLAWHTAFEDELTHEEAWRLFSQFIGSEIDYVSDKDDYYTVPAITAERVRVLLGPHAHTMIKAWQAVHEPSVETPRKKYRHLR